MIRLARTALALKPKRLSTVNYTERKNLPESAAVYVAIENGSVIYVGQTINLRRRWNYHQLNYYPCTIEAVKIAYLCESNKFNRELLELFLIITLRPKFNGQGVSATSKGIASSNLRQVLQIAHCKSYKWTEKPKGKSK